MYEVKHNGRMVDSSRLAAMGWRAETSLPDGLRKIYQWYLSNQ